MRALLSPCSARLQVGVSRAKLAKDAKEILLSPPPRRGEESGGGLNGAVSADTCLPDRRRRAWRLNSLNGLSCPDRCVAFVYSASPQ